MKHFKLKVIITTLVVMSLANTTLADLRIKRKVTTPQETYEIVIYLKGARQRKEMSPATGDKNKQLKVAFVEQCDLKQLVWIDLINERYAIHTGGVPAAAAMAFNEQQTPVDQDAVNRAKSRSKGLLTETVTVTDTGERREMFGFTARHLKTITSWEANPRTCKDEVMKFETDGWYVDLLYGIDCSPDLSGAMPLNTSFSGSECFSRYAVLQRYWIEHKRSGPSRGFPLSEVITAYNDKGVAEVTTDEVLELSSEVLDESLFTAPSGFTRVEFKNYRRSFFDRLVSLLLRR